MHCACKLHRCTRGALASCPGQRLQRAPCSTQAGGSWRLAMTFQLHAGAEGSWGPQLHRLASTRYCSVTKLHLKCSQQHRAASPARFQVSHCARAHTQASSIGCATAERDGAAADLGAHGQRAGQRAGQQAQHAVCGHRLAGHWGHAGRDGLRTGQPASRCVWRLWQARPDWLPAGCGR